MKNTATTLRDSLESRSSSPDPLNPLLISLNIALSKAAERLPADLVGDNPTAGDPHLLSRSGISLIARRTWLLRSLPAYTTPKVPLPRTTRSPCSSYS